MEPKWLYYFLASSHFNNPPLLVRTRKTFSGFRTKKWNYRGLILVCPVRALRSPSVLLLFAFILIFRVIPPSIYYFHKRVRYKVQTVCIKLKKKIKAHSQIFSFTEIIHPGNKPDQCGYFRIWLRKKIRFTYHLFINLLTLTEIFDCSKKSKVFGNVVVTVHTAPLGSPCNLTFREH